MLIKLRYKIIGSHMFEEILEVYISYYGQGSGYSYDNDGDGNGDSYEGFSGNSVKHRYYFDTSLYRYKVIG